MQVPANVTRPRVLSSVLKWEAHPDFSRESGVAGAALVLGQVLGKVTAGGKLVPLAPAATDGSQNAYGFAHDDVDGDGERMVLSARQTLASASGLVWPAGITDSQKAAAIAALDVRGIVVRNY